MYSQCSAGLPAFQRAFGSSGRPRPHSTPSMLSRATLCVLRQGGELTLSVRSGECQILPNTTVVCSQPRVSLLRKQHWCAFKHQTAEVVKVSSDRRGTKAA